MNKTSTKLNWVEHVNPTGKNLDKSTWLEKYAKNPYAVIRPFIQFDCYPDSYDDVFDIDDDGDLFTGRFSHDLRFSGPELAVRVQIHDGSKKEDVIRLLKKLIKMIETQDCIS